MSSPYARLRTEDEELMYDAGRMDMRDDIIKLLEELKTKMHSMEVEGYKRGSENMPIRAAGVGIAINTIKEKMN